MGSSGANPRKRDVSGEKKSSYSANSLKKNTATNDRPQSEALLCDQVSILGSSSTPSSKLPASRWEHTVSTQKLLEDVSLTVHERHQPEPTAAVLMRSRRKYKNLMLAQPIKKIDFTRSSAGNGASRCVDDTFTATTSLLHNRDDRVSRGSARWNTPIPYLSLNSTSFRDSNSGRRSTP